VPRRVHRKHSKQTRQMVESVAMLTSLLSIVLWMVGTGSSPGWLRALLIGVTLILAVIVSRRWLVEWRREGIGTQPLKFNGNLEHEKAPYRVSVVSLKSDLARVVEFESRFFPDEVFDLGRVVKMWSRYRSAVTFAEDGATGDVISIAGLWPIQRDTYLELVQAEREEGEIQVGDIAYKFPHQYWWFSCIATEEKKRKLFPELTVVMLKSVFGSLQTACNESKEIGIVTTALTPQGAKLAQRLGMASVKGKSSELYVIEGHATDVLRRLTQRTAPPSIDPQ